MTALPRGHSCLLGIYPRAGHGEASGMRYATLGEVLDALQRPPCRGSADGEVAHV